MVRYHCGHEKCTKVQEFLDVQDIGLQPKDRCSIPQQTVSIE